MLRCFFRSVLTLAVLTSAGAVAFAQDWANWRGPNYNGSAEQMGLPAKFSPKEGVKWSVALPGPSAATPIIYGNNVFISSTDLKTEKMVAFCFDRKTGQMKWRQNVESGLQTAGLRRHERNNFAAPSPVTDGKVVIFAYGNGDLIAFDMQGRRLWIKNLQNVYGEFAIQWTFSSSPTLYEGKLYLQVLQRARQQGQPDSYLLALNPYTGKEIFRHIRPSEAKVESQEAYSTPIPFDYKGRKELILSGGDVLTGHDPATGRELWRWGTWNEGHRQPYWRLVPSPVVGDGVILACAPKRAPVYAAKAGTTGESTSAGLVWASEERGPVSSDVPTPLFYKGKFFVLSDVKRNLSCVNPTDGKLLWSTPLTTRQMCWGSPTGADGKVYVIDLDGEVTVLDAATGKVLSINVMAVGDGNVRSTIAAAHGNLFIRTSERLYCIGK